MALNEQVDDIANFKFTQVAEDWARQNGQPPIISLMNKLSGSQEAVAISDLLKAVIKVHHLFD